MGARSGAFPKSSLARILQALLLSPTMRRSRLFLLITVLSVLPLQASSQEPTSEGFIVRLRDALESRDLPRYIGLFAPALRESERASFASRIEENGPTS